jgi:hypothetical protein
LPFLKLSTHIFLPVEMGGDTERMISDTKEEQEGRGRRERRGNEEQIRLIREKEGEGERLQRREWRRGGCRGVE